MQKLIKAFENMMVAVTFAESGEYDVARRISGRDDAREEDVAINAGLKTAAKS